MRRTTDGGSGAGGRGPGAGAEGNGEPGDGTGEEGNGGGAAEAANPAAGPPEQVFAPGALFRPRLMSPPARRRAKSAGKGSARATESARGTVIGVRVPLGKTGSIAVGATLTAAAIRLAQSNSASSTSQASLTPTLSLAREREQYAIIHSSLFILHSSDLRVPIRAKKSGHLLLFVVDASGSMAARKRMSLVKSTVLSLLVDAYRRRYQVGLITFRGESADLLLPPTRSIDLAERLLRRLPTGGRTPLADGLRLAESVVRRSGDDAQPLLIVISDGRATAGLGGDPLADAQRLAGIIRDGGTPSLVINSEEGPVKLGLAAQLAGALGAPCLPISALDADRVREAIRWATSAAGPRP